MPVQMNIFQRNISKGFQTPLIRKLIEIDMTPKFNTEAC